MSQINEIQYRAKGAAARLFVTHAPEVLLDGPAGTGKTRAFMEYLHWLCEQYPGMRALVARDTRVSMTESVLVTWEKLVLWPGHPMLEGPERENRHSYKHPNSSEIVCGGLDNPDRIMSTEYDIIYVPEATEAKQEAWGKLSTRLRNKHIPKGAKSGGPRRKKADGEWAEDQAMEPDPFTGELKPAWFTQAWACVNPNHPLHWINVRATPKGELVWKGSDIRGTGEMVRLKSRHEDNPSVDAAYLNRLRSLKGTNRKRLYEGIWCHDDTAAVFDTEKIEQHQTEKGKDGCFREEWTFDRDGRVDISGDVTFREGEKIERGRITVYRTPNWGHNYCIGHDSAYGLEGKDKDYAVVLDRNTGEIVAEAEGWWGNAVWQRVLAQLHRYYNGAFICGEKQVGLVHMRALIDVYGIGYQYRSRREEDKNRPKRDTLGHWRTHGDVAMGNLIAELSRPAKDCGVKILSPEIKRQVQMYQFLPKREKMEFSEAADADLQMGAPPGDHDDGVLALVYAWLGVQEVPFFESERPKFRRGTYGHMMQKEFDALYGQEQEKEVDPFAA
jgi:hypothetical protein